MDDATFILILKVAIERLPDGLQKGKAQNLLEIVSQIDDLKQRFLLAATDYKRYMNLEKENKDG